ncbi:SKP1/BTB/POZ domain superfamily [Fusarium oxysporum f. sp. vasinfectum]|nr:SKP1/BTB/POZ domain superfamily [Fusarium oxysporum f. sp. vasinfectum]
MDQNVKRRAPNDFGEQESTRSVAISKVFTFIVSPEETEFTIHSALVAKQSPVLNVLVNGPFKEALEQRVKWPDLDEATFLSFWEFAYSGNYAKPIQEDEEEEETDPGDEELGRWGKSWAHYFMASGKNLSRNAPVPRPADVGDIGADTLLHHARVCAFADRYCMDKLTEISLGKLFLALEATIPWGDSWNAVMELLVLTSGKFVPMRLRQIVADYIICQAELFRDEEVFQNFVWDHGGPMRELLRQVVETEEDE